MIYYYICVLVYAWLRVEKQACLNHIPNWCNEWRGKISKQKSTAILFSDLKSTKKHNIELKSNGEIIEVENEMKFLSMIFDQHLTRIKLATYNG